MNKISQTQCSPRGAAFSKRHTQLGRIAGRNGAVFTLVLSLFALTGCSTVDRILEYPNAIKHKGASPRQASDSPGSQPVLFPLNNLPPGVVLSQPDPSATPKSLPAGTYEQFLVRQSDCSLSRAFGSILAGTVNGLLPNYQGDMRAIAHLPPNSLPAAYPNGCADSALGLAASPHLVIAGQLANGNYYGAMSGNTGVITYITNQLTSYTSNTIDTSNGSSTASPTSVAAADLNEDGVADLVVANYDYASSTGNNISVLLAKSDGTYGAVTQIPMLVSAQQVEGITIADANGDGRPDLLFEAIGVNGAFNLVVALGKGDGTFAPLNAVIAQPVPPYNNGSTEAGGGALAAADLNGDGHIDLVDSNGYVFLGDGSGNFKLLSTAPIPGSGNASLAIADFNHDGRPDIAFTNYQRSTVSIVLGKGDGTFTQGLTYATVNGPLEIHATDLDGDGNVDLAVGISGAGLFGPGGEEGGLADYLLGRGDGTFAAPRVFAPVVGVAQGQPPPVVADFDGDGKPDLVAIGPSTALTNLVLTFSAGHGDGTFASPQQSVTAPSAFSIGSYSILLNADLNGDGKQDILLVSETAGGGFSAFLGNGDGTFQNPTLLQPVSAGATPFLATIADFTGDGKPDLVVLSTVGTASTGLLLLFPGNGDGTFGAAQTIDTYGATQGLGYSVGNQMAAADLNGDGKADLLVYLAGTFVTASPVYTTTPPVANVYLSKGGGTFSSSPIPGVGPTEPISGFGVGDLNGDGIPDLVLGQSTTVQFQGATLLPGKGDGTFAAGTPLTLVSPAPTGTVSIQDLDNDGNKDLFYQGNCPGTKCGTIALGDGDGTFSTTLPVLLGFPTLISDADLNGDGLPDLILASFYGPVAVVLNNGFGSSLDLPGSGASTTKLSVSPNPAALGQSITFVATVAAGTGATGTPTGTVTFLNGSTSLGTGTLSSGSATFSTSSLAAGTYSVTASYAGDSTFAASASAALSFTVSAAPLAVATSTTLTASSSTAAVGTNLTFTALIAPASGSGTPTGSVVFSDGTAQLGTATLDGTGKATYSTSSLAVGAHSITASYPGDANYSASVSSPVSVTITAAPADFSISLAQTSGTVSSGNSITSTITIAPTNGFNQAVSLSCSGAPKNATCSINPSTVTPGGTSPATATLTVQTGVTIAALARPMPFGGSSGSVALGFVGGGGVLGCALLLRRRRPLWTQFLTILAFSVGLIAAATGCGGSSYATPSGTYTVTVNASSGADSHTVNYSLSVK